MADAWGGAWGVSWGQSWGASVTPVVTAGDTHDPGPDDWDVEGERARRWADEVAARARLLDDLRGVHAEVRAIAPAAAAAAIPPLADEPLMPDGVDWQALANLSAPVLAEILATLRDMASQIDNDEAIALILLA